MMSQRRWLALLLAVSLFTAAVVGPQFARAEDEDDEEMEMELDEEEAPADTGFDEKDVVVLTSKNFEDVVKKAKYALVEFYAPWCGHCKSLAPEYAKAATVLKAHDDTIVLGKVDATVEEDLGKEYGVQGFPTLKWFVDGEATEYGGGRTEEDIVKWVKKKSGPPAINLDSAEKAKTVREENEVVVIGYFKALKGDDHDAFIKAATTEEDVEFYITDLAAVAKVFGLDKPGIAVATNFDETPATAVFDGSEVTNTTIVEFIKGEKLPPYLEFKPDNQKKIFGSGIQLNIIVVGDDKALAKDGAVMKAMLAAHKATKGKIVFVTSSTDGENAGTITEYFGLPAKPEEPVAVGFNIEKGIKYRLKGALTEKSLAEFADDLVSGKLKPEYKSEEIPEDVMDGDVTVVVGKNFDDIVLDPTKDVLLEAYAPWCGHCKELAPTWKKLGKRFRKVDSVVIAKVDGTANEHELLTVQGFPTIWLFPAGENKEPITFEGSDRSLKGFTQFIKENAKIPFELPKKSKKEEATEAKEEAKEEAESDTGKDEL